ncbi:MAG: hypothetical protein WCL59_06850 [Cyanobium sp. ELA507]
MSPYPSARPPAPAARRRLPQPLGHRCLALPLALLPSLPTSLAVLLGLATPLLAMPGSACAAPPLPYPEAVLRGRRAAEAVLAGAGAETCLRGKITRALLNLSDSCSVAANHGPLCAMADRAVVVTPMSLGFMRDTAREILALSSPGP